jgi:hypothetical protein
MVMQHGGGRWHGPNDAGYQDGPVPVALADYVVVRKVDLRPDAA